MKTDDRRGAVERGHCFVFRIAHLVCNVAPDGMCSAYHLSRGLVRCGPIQFDELGLAASHLRHGEKLLGRVCGCSGRADEDTIEGRMTLTITRFGMILGTTSITVLSNQNLYFLTN